MPATRDAITGPPTPNAFTSGLNSVAFARIDAEAGFDAMRLLRTSVTRSPHRNGDLPPFRRQLESG
jgi:hypothetical protein